LSADFHFSPCGKKKENMVIESILQFLGTKCFSIKEKLYLCSEKATFETR